MRSEAEPISSRLGLRAFLSSSHDPARNLALEEGLLERGNRDLDRVLGKSQGYLLLYVNDPCIVIGRSQNPWEEAWSEILAPGGGAAILRRASGGGSVWHDRGNLNWALVMPRKAHDREAELELVARAVSGLGATVGPGERGGLFAGADTSCPGAKLSGTARRFSAQAVLHHGTLLVDSDLDRLRGALRGRGFAASRALASVPSPVTRLADLLPGMRLETAMAGLIEGLCGRGGQAEGIEDFLEGEGALEERLARHHSWEWVYGESPEFTFETGGSEACLVHVKRGLVSSIEAASPGLYPERIGGRFDPRHWI